MNDKTELMPRQTFWLLPKTVMSMSVAGVKSQFRAAGALLCEKQVSDTAMRFYFTDSQVPELAQFTKVKRQAIIRGAHELHRQTHPAGAWIGALYGLAGIIVGAIAFAIVPLVDPTCTLGIKVLTGMLCAYIGGSVVKHCHLLFIRPYLRQYIEEHRDQMAAEEIAEQ